MRVDEVIRHLVANLVELVGGALTITQHVVDAVQSTHERKEPLSFKVNLLLLHVKTILRMMPCSYDNYPLKISIIAKEKPDGALGCTCATRHAKSQY